MVVPDRAALWPWDEGSEYVGHPRLWPRDFDVYSDLSSYDLVDYDPGAANE